MKLSKAEQETLLETLDDVNSALLQRLIANGSSPRGLLIVCLDGDEAFSHYIVAHRDRAFVQAFFRDVADYATAQSEDANVPIEEFRTKHTLNS